MRSRPNLLAVRSGSAKIAYLLPFERKKLGSPTKYRVSRSMADNLSPFEPLPLAVVNTVGVVCLFDALTPQYPRCFLGHRKNSGGLVASLRVSCS